MNPHRIALLLALFLASSSFAQQNEPLPSMQELQQLRDQKQWQALLQKLSRVIVLKGNAAQPYDRYELLMMKGEAHLQLKQGSAAIQAFGDAAKESKEQKDKAAVASSTALLIKRAQNFVYKRKTATTQPADKNIDVLDQGKRKEAFAALAADEYASLKAKAEAATKATNLGGVIEVMKSLGDLKGAEVASGGDTKLADQLLAPLAAHSKDLTAKAISSDRAKIDAIEKSANQVIDVAPPRGSYGGTQKRTNYRVYKKRGLNYNDQQSLKQVIDECNTISTGNKQLADVFGDVGKPLLEVVADADKLAERAKVILDTDYSATSDTPPPSK